MFQNVLEQMVLRKESTVEGCMNTLAEGSSLIEQLRFVIRSSGIYRLSSSNLSLSFSGSTYNSGIGQSAESDATGSFAVIETSMERLNQLKEEVLTVWNDQNTKLELYIQWKMWERDSLEVRILSIDS